MSWVHGSGGSATIDPTGGDVGLSSTYKLEFLRTSDAAGPYLENDGGNSTNSIALRDSSDDHAHLDLQSVTCYDSSGNNLTTVNTAQGLRLASGKVVTWSSSATAANSPDTGLARESAGTLEITDGSTGAGDLKMRSGGQVLADGAAGGSAPAYSFTGETNTGFGQAGQNGRFYIYASGVTIAGVDGAGIDTFINGSASAPALALNNSGDSDTNTGFYKPADNQIGITAGGTERARISSSGLDVGPSTLLLGSAIGTLGASLDGDKHTGLTDAAAETVASVTLADTETAAAVICVSVEAVDATEEQRSTAVYVVCARNDGGTVTGTVTELGETTEASSGTLALAAAVADGGSGVANFQLTPTSSLTPTSLLSHVAIIGLSDPAWSQA